MHIVCNTKKSDVKGALKCLLDERNADEIYEWSEVERTSIIQVSMKDYKHLKTITAQQGMSDQVKRREAKHIINLNTLTVHKKDCSHAGKAALKAALINVKNTGLRICKHCR